MQQLRVSNHDRDSANLRYVYPVVSRRAQGVSIGINLNPNNACNFRCIYCQVPELVFGKGPEIDLDLLERELREMLGDVLHGDFMARRVPEGSRRLNDLAVSGNGEPTSSPQFLESVQLIRRLLSEFQIESKVEVVLITNGTLTDRPAVEQGIREMSRMNGRVWFKFDSATAEGALRINGSKASVQERLERLRRVASWCPTWIQTCVFAQHGKPPTEGETSAYLAALSQLVHDEVPLQGVLLYGLARPSMQPEAPTLEQLDASWLDAFAERIRDLGLTVRVTP